MCKIVYKFRQYYMDYLNKCAIIMCAQVLFAMSKKIFFIFLRYSGFNVRIISCINILFNLVVLYSPKDDQ